METEHSQAFYDFASFRLDLKKRRLTYLGEIVALTPKEFDVLLTLVENADRVVEKDELLRRVWSDTFVEEGTLARNISWLRKKLSKFSPDLQIIETLPKRGYRFLPEVKTGGAGAFLVEEKTIQHIQIEEIIEIVVSDDEIAKIGAHSGENPPNLKLLPAAPPKKRFSPLWLVIVVPVFALFAFVAYRGFFPPKFSPPVRAPKIVPFSGLPGRETTPAFSPDGRQLLYAWDGGAAGENLDIYVKIIGAGEPVRITKNLADEINPVFSPDGKFIAFVRSFADHNEIVLIPALGGAERVIEPRASYASVSFSPDGKSLAAASLDLSKGDAGIWLINLETSEKTRLTMPEAPSVDHTPRFSPDGNNLAFIRYFSSFRREILVVPVTGGEPRQITNDNVRIYGLAWNPDSQKIFFTSFRDAERLNLWETSLSGSQPQLIPTNSKNLESLAVSPDGKTIAYTEETADENVWEIEDEKARPLIHSTRADHSQQFAPDGAKIVFASDRTGNYEIWIADADGKNQRQLTETRASAGSPRFSPDGTQIVFDAQIADKSDIYTIGVNGGTPRRLTEAGKNNFLPAWSADSEFIYFISNLSGENQIWKMPAAGGDAVQLTKEGAFEMFAAPDGKTIIYSKGSGKTGLWQVGTDGTDEKSIPELAGAGAWRSWFVGTKGVYYTEFSAQPPFRLKVFDFAARRVKEIAAVEKSPLLYYSNLSVSADGEKILYARQDQSASAIMFAELSK